MTICKWCSHEHIRKRAERSKTRQRQFVYRDNNGELWAGLVCPCCRKKYYESLDRRDGVKKRTDHKNDRIEKAVLAESKVKKYFEKMGFNVEMTNGYGPDLTCEMFDLKITVEVKSVMRVRIGEKYDSYYVGRVEKNRLNDDLIAIVLPSGIIHLEEMRAHLQKCRTGGQRSVTNLVRRDARLKS